MILLHEQLQVFRKNHENKVFPNLPVHTNELLHYLCPVFTEIYELDRTLAWGIVLLRHRKTKRVMRTLKIVPFIEESTHALFEKEVYWLKTIAHKKISPKVFRITNNSDMYVNITEQFGVFAMESIVCTLTEMINESVDVSVVRVLMEDYFHCVMTLRTLGLLHTDLYPENIVIKRHQKKFKVLLFDFSAVVEYSTIKHLVLDSFHYPSQVYENASTYLFLHDLVQHEKLFPLLEYPYDLYGMFSTYLKKRHPGLYEERTVSFYFKHRHRYTASLSNEQVDYINHAYPFPLNFRLYYTLLFVLRYNDMLQDIMKTSSVLVREHELKKVYTVFKNIQKNTNSRCFPNLPLYENLTRIDDIFRYLYPLLEHTYFFGGLIACGIQGCVFRLQNKHVLENGEVQYLALKVVAFTEKTTSAFFRREIRLIAKASTMDIAPHVFSLPNNPKLYFLNNTEHYGMFLMDNIDYTLDSVLKQITDNPSSNELLVFDRILEAYFDCILLLRKLRILHSDLHPLNIGIKHVTDDTVKVYILDFGLAIKYKSLKRVLVKTLHQPVRMYKNVYRYLFFYDFVAFDLVEYWTRFRSYLELYRPSVLPVLTYYIEHKDVYVDMFPKQELYDILHKTFPFPLHNILWRVFTYVYRMNLALRDFKKTKRRNDEESMH